MYLVSSLESVHARASLWHTQCIAMMHGLSCFSLEVTPSVVPTMTDAPSVASPIKFFMPNCD